MRKTSMRKWFTGFFLFIFLCAPAKSQDITLFDFPLLLGDWYWFVPLEQEENHTIPYKAISISFNSDYRFALKLLLKDGNIEQALGEYDIDDNTLVLNDDYGGSQLHEYQLNHNKLLLRGTEFTKILPQDLSGVWYSNLISGKDVGDHVKDLSLILSPDFLFSAKVSDGAGKSITRQGVYYLEDDHLVLIYQGGQQDSRFVLNNDVLTLFDPQFDMQAVFQREE